MDTNVVNLKRRMVQKGYSILEVMLTLVVVGVGILAIVQLQSGLSVQVGDNKAKAEATTIAEARIEELRNYTNKVADLDEFKEVLLATSDTNESINGVNANFTRNEVIIDGGDTMKVTINVSWEDRTETTRNISVTSEIAYVSPAAAGQKGIDNSGGDFSLPTGGAKPGEGKFTDITNPSTPLPNDDKTSVTDDGEDVYLFDQDTEDILLVLENACETEDDGTVTCDDFTRIHGRVYIDKTSFTNKNVEPVTVGAVDVVASNSAYCTEFVIKPEGQDEIAFLYDSDGRVINANGPIQRVEDIPEEKLADAGMSTTTDYDYFDYTCYVGRGWYGNVGVYVYFDPDIYGGETTASSLGRQTQSCMGDPGGDADEDDGSYSGGEEYDDFNSEYALSSYRAYRGMIYTDESNVKTIQSIGVAGDRELGLADDTESGDYKPNHNFVISLISASADVGDCLEVSNKPGPLKRNDSNNGLLFSGVVDDFVCLNTDDSYYLDDYDKLTYSADYCPLDPTTVVTP